MMSSHNGSNGRSHCISFIIALKAKAVSKDWDQTSYLLERTLWSILRQRDARFKIIVACHDLPKISRNIRSNVHFLEVDFPNPEEYSSINQRRIDRICKQAAGLRLIAQNRISHYMFVDADDVISCNTAHLAFSNQFNAVKILKMGYIIDETTKQLWLVDRFSSLCGTCGIFPFDDRLFAQIERDITVCDLRKNPEVIYEKNLYSLMNHTRWAKAAEQSGLPVAHISVPHAIYRWNHGDQTNDPKVFRLSIGKSIRRHLPPVFSRGKRWKPVQINNAIRQEFCL